MIPPRIWLAAVCLTAIGCGDKPPKTPSVSEVFPNLPLPPQPSFVSRAGGPDALQITVRTPTKAADVEAYYREILSRPNWRLVSQVRDGEGALVLLAEQEGPPLWVRIRSTDDSTATLVELAGAVLARDSAKTAPKRAT